MNVRLVPPLSLEINNPNRFVFAAICLLSVVVMLGCVSVEEEQWDPTEKENVLLAISHVQGAAGSAEEFKQVFAAGSVPAETEREKYQPYMFKTSTDAIDITGNTATAKVTVEDTMTSDTVGEVEWTLTKVGEAWKVTAAPLP